MLGVVDKFISNIFSKSPPKISDTYKSKQYIICIFIIMVVETESTKDQPVDI
jgi:hypothetical protein